MGFIEEYMQNGPLHAYADYLEMGQSPVEAYKSVARLLPEPFVDPVTLV